MASITKTSLLFASFVLIFTIRCEAEPDIPIVKQQNLANQTGSKTPSINECVAIPIKVDSIYLKWKTNDTQNIIKRYSLWYQKNGTHQSTELPADKFDAMGRTDYLLNSTEFEKGEGYGLGIEAIDSNRDSLGNCLAYFRVLKEELIFKPFVNGSTNTSIMISWTQPKVDFPQHYRQQMNITEVNSTSELIDWISSPNSKNITNLKPDTKYLFYGRICIVNTTYCGNWSTPTEGHTTSSSSSSIPSSSTSSSSTSTFHASIISNLVAVVTVFLIRFFSKR